MIRVKRSKKLINMTATRCYLLTRLCSFKFCRTSSATASLMRQSTDWVKKAMISSVKIMRFIAISIMRYTFFPLVAIASNWPTLFRFTKDKCDSYCAILRFYTSCQLIISYALFRYGKQSQHDYSWINLFYLVTGYNWLLQYKYPVIIIIL